MISEELNKEDDFAQLMLKSKLVLHSEDLENNIIDKILQTQLYKKRVRKNIKMSIFFSVLSIFLGIFINISITKMSFSNRNIPCQVAILLFQTTIVLLFILLTENLIKFFKAGKKNFLQ